MEKIKMRWRTLLIIVLCFVMGGCNFVRKVLTPILPVQNCGPEPTVDKGSADYQDYLKTIRNKINKSALRYSHADQTGTVLVTLEVKSNGRLKKVDIDYERTQATQALIDQTILAVKRAAPFPPFPHALKKEYKSLTVTTQLVYKKNQTPNCTE